MCNPIVMAVASAASSYAGQRAAANAQEKAQAQASAAEQVRAQRANTAVRLREAQENTARSQRTEAAQVQTMEAKSRARLIALTESGIAGMSLERLTDSLTAKQARYAFSEKQQQKMQAQQTGLELEEGAIRSRMNQLRINQPIKQASLLEAGLQGMQTGMQTAQVFPSK
jgi:hypothetical protein